MNGTSFRVLHLFDGEARRWCVISPDAKHPPCWYVVARFDTSDGALEYLDALRSLQRDLATVG